MAPTIIDLSHRIEAGMPVYPGDPAPQVVPVAAFGGEGYRTERLSIGTHVGTHMASPGHFVDAGLEIDAVALERCVAPGIVLDVRDAARSGAIDAQAIAEAERRLGRVAGNGDAVLLWTARDAFWPNQRYLEESPGLTIAAAELVLTRGVALVGIDAVSIEPLADEAFPVHRLLLEAGMLIVENLRGLEAVSTKAFTFVAAPLAIAGATGSPVRALALLGFCT